MKQLPDQPTPRVHCEDLEQTAHYLVSRGFLAQALDTCDDVLRLCPSSANVLRLRGKLLWRQEEIPEALASFDEAVTSLPSCTVTAPLACLAILPVSIERGLFPHSNSTFLIMVFSPPCFYFLMPSSSINFLYFGGLFLLR